MRVGYLLHWFEVCTLIEDWETDARVIQSHLYCITVSAFKHVVTVQAVKLLTPQMWRSRGTIDLAVQVKLVHSTSHHVYYPFLIPQLHFRLAQQQTKLPKQS